MGVTCVCGGIDTMGVTCVCGGIDTMGVTCWGVLTLWGLHACVGVP